MRSIVFSCVYTVVASVVAWMVASATPAQAEPRHTLAPVALHRKPGESEPVVARLPANTEVIVLGVEGRWLRVRANGLEGYLTRTTVSAIVPADTAPAGQWSAARKASGGALVAVVAPAAVEGAPPRPDAARVGKLGRGANRLEVRADLGIGYRALGMDLTSNAEGGLTNYVLDAGAVAATLDADAVLRLSGAVFVAGDVRAAASDSSPGVDYPGPTSPAGKIPFRTFEVDAGARIGARLHRAFDVALRAGGHYDAFLAASVANPGMLPRERLLGATLGAHVDIAPEHSRFVITARFDALIAGGRRQTSGLEDGTSSTARALWGGLTMRYALGHRLAVFGGYDFGRASTEWTGRSTRQPGASRTRRIDTAQLIQIGLGTEL